MGRIAPARSLQRPSSRPSDGRLRSSHSSPTGDARIATVTHPRSPWSPVPPLEGTRHSAACIRPFPVDLKQTLSSSIAAFGLDRAAVSRGPTGLPLCRPNSHRLETAAIGVKQPRSGRHRTSRLGPAFISRRVFRRPGWRTSFARGNEGREPSGRPRGERGAYWTRAAVSGRRPKAEGCDTPREVPNRAVRVTLACAGRRRSRRPGRRCFGPAWRT
jgi:hypothetical protein